ncbi:MAG: outer membrane protein assembly factor BamD [Kiritimatiellia bacterium]
MMVLFAVLPEPCTAQQGGGVTTSPDYALFSMKLNQIPGLMAAEKYNDALKNIEHCVTWMKDKLEKDPRLNQPFEYCHFVRAVCRLQLKEYDAATGEFSKYLGLFPQGRFRRNAIILWADAHAAKDEWNKVVEVILPVFKDPGIKYIEQLAAYQLLGEARFKLEQWKEAIDPLKWLFVNGSYESRTDVASMLAICFIRIDDFETLYKFIPAVFKTPARYDVRLQMTLMEEGDRHYGEGNIDKALLLFRLIYPKTELIMQLQKRTQDLQRQRNEAVQREKADLEVNASVIRKIERALKVYAEQLKQINEVPDYDIELRVRVANCYHELQRFLEAWLLFKQIHKDDPKHKLAQRSLYSAFAAALEMKDIERALKDGYGYLDEYPKGEFWDTVTINLATIHLERTEFEKAIAVCERALKVNPEHLLKDNVLYIIGYSQFMLSNLEGGLASLERIFNEHPQSGFLQYSMYYHALGYLFLQRYTPARQEFASFLNRFKGGPMVEEVSYRIGVAYYGEGNFDKAAEVLQSFLERYPDSINRSEAFAMLADIQGSRGELDEALKNYDNALPPAVNMVQVDYAVMQKSRTLELESRYDEIIALWSGYSAKYKELANFTEAIYWIGSTQKKQNKLEECLNTFYDGIVKYGDDPANHGIDMILRDLESELKELPDAAGGAQENEEQRKSAALLRAMKDRLYGEIREAIAKNRKTLEMRLISLFANLAATAQIKDPLVNSLINERLIEKAGPYTLNTMAREAKARNMPDFAYKVYDQFLTAHSTSDLALDAFRGKAELAMTQNDFKTAEPLLSLIAERYPSLDDAGWAHIRLGQIQLSRKTRQGGGGHPRASAPTSEGRPSARGCPLRPGRGPPGPGQRRRGLRLPAHLRDVQRLVPNGRHVPGAAAECLLKLGCPDEAKATLNEFCRTPFAWRGRRRPRRPPNAPEIHGRGYRHAPPARPSFPAADRGGRLLLRRRGPHLLPGRAPGLGHRPARAHLRRHHQAEAQGPGRVHLRGGPQGDQGHLLQDALRHRRRPQALRRRRLREAHRGTGRTPQAVHHLPGHQQQRLDLPDDPGQLLPLLGQVRRGHRALRAAAAQLPQGKPRIPRSPAPQEHRPARHQPQRRNREGPGPAQGAGSDRPHRPALLVLDGQAPDDDQRLLQRPREHRAHRGLRPQGLHLVHAGAVHVRRGIRPHQRLRHRAPDRRGTAHRRPGHRMGRQGRQAQGAGRRGRAPPQGSRGTPGPGGGGQGRPEPVAPEARRRKTQRHHDRCKTGRPRGGNPAGTAGHSITRRT